GEIAQEWLALEHFEIVGEVQPVIRRDLQRHALDLGRRLERRDRHPEEREEDDDCAASDREQGEPAPAHAGRRHRFQLTRQYSIGLRSSRHCSTVMIMSVTKTKTAITEASPKRKYLNAVS